MAQRDRARSIVAAPPVADAVAAIPATARKPATRGRSENANARPNQRSSNQATKTASPALQMLLSIEVMRPLSLMTLAATAPATRPIISAGRARLPKTIRNPTAMPVTGQNADTPEGRASNASPSCATKKKTTVKRPAQQSVALQAPASGTECQRAPCDTRVSLKVPPKRTYSQPYTEAAGDEPVDCPARLMPARRSR